MTGQETSMVALVGTLRPEPQALRLAAGPLSAEFEGGALRYIRYGEQEIVHAISFLVRDENWGTYAITLQDSDIHQAADTFTLRFRGACGPGGSELCFSALITGHADGRLTFTADAVLHDDLLTNRSGFVVLHPLAVSGRPVIVETTDGRRTATTFPEQIDPLQPFLDIRSLTTQHSASLSAEVRMEGDTFEMEDQRNWSDASFKTYVRPLALPWPYTLARGLRFSQSISVTVREAAAAAPRQSGSALPKAAPARIALRPAAMAMPHIGIGLRAEHLPAALRHADALRMLAPAYFIGHLDLRRDDPAGVIAANAHLAGLAGIPYVLEAVLTGEPDPAAELAAIAAAMRACTPACALQVSPAPDLKAVLPGSPWPPCPSFEEIFGAARDAFPGTPLGGGSFAYFTEFNRKRAPAGLLDYVTFTTCPIVHAADDRSVMETLDTLPFIAASARALYPSTPYRVGPSSIAARDNPYGAATLPNQDGAQGERICLTDNDPRQRALFGAAWNLGYFARFAMGGASHIALSELAGPRGMFDGDRPTPWFHLFAALASWRGGSLLEARIERGGGPLAAFAVERGGSVALWLANLAAGQQGVELEAPGRGATIARWNSDTNFAAAPPHGALSPGPIALRPYETVEIHYTA